jgi:hypothetical protein
MEFPQYMRCNRVSGTWLVDSCRGIELFSSKYHLEIDLNASRLSSAKTDSNSLVKEGLLLLLLLLL